MTYSLKNQVSEEHQYMLELCNQLEIQLNNISHEDGYYQAQQIIEELHYLIINIHYPKDKLLTDEINASGINSQWIRLLLDFQYPASLESVNHAVLTINCVSAGSIVSRDLIISSAQKMIEQLRIIINFEEQVCLPCAA